MNPRILSVNRSILAAVSSGIVFALAAVEVASAQQAVSRPPQSSTVSATTTTTSSRSSTTDTFQPEVVVRGEELPSAYGAPPEFSRTRFTPLVTAYVLPPGSFFVGALYQGDVMRHGPPAHVFTQEVEVGLPHRFGVAVENRFDRSDGEGQESTISLEARYALADWNKIPLNPTLFFEYKFGIGHVTEEEMMPEEDMDEPEALHRLNRLQRRQEGDEDEGGDEEGGPPKQPDAVEFRLLLAQDFGEKVEWAANLFFEQETSGDRGREWGFAQSAALPLTPNERLKAGIEMLYTNFTDKGIRDNPIHSFVIGPTVAWKPSRSTRIDVSPLFGVTDDSPRVSIYAIFSMLLGPGGAEEGAEAPASTRNR